MAIKSIDATTLKDWLEKRAAVLIDVRDPQEHAAEHIPGAISMPLTAVSRTNLPEIGKKKLVLHCQMGKRSMNACEKLAAEDPSLEIFTLEGGINAWTQEGNHVKKN